MDAFELLKADHKKVAKLLDLLETASGKRKKGVKKPLLVTSQNISIGSVKRLE